MTYFSVRNMITLPTKRLDRSTILNIDQIKQFFPTHLNVRPALKADRTSQGSSPGMSKVLSFFLVSSVLLLCAAGAFAQSTTTGAINGTVLNPNKEVVAGATVTAKNKGTNKEDSTTTDDNGTFRLTNLQPGSYTVSVNASGFAPFTN